MGNSRRNNQKKVRSTQHELTRRAVVTSMLGVAGLVVAGDGLSPESTSRAAPPIAVEQGYTVTLNVNSIAELRDQRPIPGATLFVLGYYSPGDGGGGFFYADTDDISTPDDGGMTIQPNAPFTDQGRWKRLWSGVISIRYFGALCQDEPEENSATPENNAIAIQRAINYAATADYTLNKQHSSPTILIPMPSRLQKGRLPGNYHVDRPIKLPRNDLSQIVIQGTSENGTGITGDFKKGEAKYDALLLPDPRPENPYSTKYLIRDLFLTVQPEVRAFYWNQVSVERIRAHFDHVFFNTGGGSVDGLLYLNGADRCLVSNCQFFMGYDRVGSIRSGIAMNIVGSFSIHDTRMTSPGAFIKAHAIECVIMGCRCEGAFGIPAWDFYDSTIGITLIQCANEGKGEWPALFRFRNCRFVTMIAPGLATAEIPWTNDAGQQVHADGILFDGCDTCTVIAPTTVVSMSGPQWPSEYGTVVAVRALENCSYIVVRGASTIDRWLPEYEYKLDGRYCYVEALTDRGRRLISSGVTPADTLLLRNTSSPPAAPAAGTEMGGYLYCKIENGISALYFKGLDGIERRIIMEEP